MSAPTSGGEARVDLSGAMGAMQQNSAAAAQANQADGNRVTTMFQRSSHPICLFFHLLFRTLALLMYLFGYAITENFVMVFVVCVLLLAFDFWTVKNVSGRLLVGLRWWNEVNEDGTTKWVFESRENNQPNPADSGVFWTTLYAYTVVWAVFAVLQLLHPSWLCITLQSVLGSSMGQSVMGSLISRGTSNMFAGGRR
ncbi:hypothetical protein BCR44DRAFT_1438952 [Catenaria anguillulae PL171]|uniref:Golgi apparatus membrane protein TVP23 n=1 Tax=Catenaria anguillulae PL171 TaxID=765915 RepID=A0A1Y2HEL3_9FUNG|nr:hypothetical protein BCR44DRAFT_1438952 [Catenaria anguillulae PL171]